MADISNKRILTNEPIQDYFGQYNFDGGSNLGKPPGTSLQSEDIDLYSRYDSFANIVPGGYLSSYQGSAFFIKNWRVRYNPNRGDTDNKHWDNPKFMAYFYDSAFHDTELNTTSGNTIKSWLNTISGQNGHRIAKINSDWWSTKGNDWAPNDIVWKNDKPRRTVTFGSSGDDETWDNYTHTSEEVNQVSRDGRYTGLNDYAGGIGAVYNWPVAPITSGGYDFMVNASNHFGQNMYDFTQAMVTADEDEYYLFIFVTHANEIEEIPFSVRVDERDAEYSYIKIPKYLLLPLFGFPWASTCGYDGHQPCDHITVCAYSNHLGRELDDKSWGHAVFSPEEQKKFGGGGGIANNFPKGAIVLNDLGPSSSRSSTSESGWPTVSESDYLYFNAEDNYGNSPGHQDDFITTNHKAPVFATLYVCIEFLAPNNPFTAVNDDEYSSAHEGWGIIEDPYGWDEENYQEDLLKSGITAIIDKEDELYGPYWYALRGSGNPLNLYAELSYAYNFWGSAWIDSNKIEYSYCDQAHVIDWLETNSGADYCFFYYSDENRQCCSEGETAENDFTYFKGNQNNKLLKINENDLKFRPISTFYTYYDNNDNNKDIQNYYTDDELSSIWASAPNNIRFEVNVIDEPTPSGFNQPLELIDTPAPMYGEYPIYGRTKHYFYVVNWDWKEGDPGGGECEILDRAEDEGAINCLGELWSTFPVNTDELNVLQDSLGKNIFNLAKIIQEDGNSGQDVVDPDGEELPYYLEHTYYQPGTYIIKTIVISTILY